MPMPMHCTHAPWEAGEGTQTERLSDPAHPVHAARTVLEEMIWSSRCVVCDMPGSPLCSSCQRNLAYIDHWQACPVCGAPFGRIICTECNTFTLHRRDTDVLPYGRCTSAVAHDDISRCIVTAYKDGGERSLAPVIARITADSLSPALAEHGTVLTFVPASAKARRRRGFDHTQEIATHLARITGMPLVCLFERPHGRDQRGLNRQQRMANMQRQMYVRRAYGETPPRSVLIFDDVCTTGATLFAASAEARAAGCSDVSCATFTRVC
jgi:predicted amidophosphoribosyltransferase